MTGDEREGHPNGEADETAADPPPGRMLARTWTIAATSRTPEDYDVPTAPRFDVTVREDGSLIVRCSVSGGVVMTAESAWCVRR